MRTVALILAMLIPISAAAVNWQDLSRAAVKDSEFHEFRVDVDSIFRNGALASVWTMANFAQPQFDSQPWGETYKYQSTLGKVILNCTARTVAHEVLVHYAGKNASRGTVSQVVWPPEKQIFSSIGQSKLLAEVSGMLCEKSSHPGRD